MVIITMVYSKTGFTQHKKEWGTDAWKAMVKWDCLIYDLESHANVEMDLKITI